MRLRFSKKSIKDQVLFELNRISYKIVTETSRQLLQNYDQEVPVNSLAVLRSAIELFK